MFRLLALLICSILPAQAITVANYSAAQFVGWKRVTIDRTPPHAAGVVNGVRYVVGRAIGKDTHVVDLKLNLAAGQVLSLDLAQAAPAPFAPGRLPANPLEFFGGMPTVAGAPLQVISLQPDGAGYTAHLRVRTTRMLVTMVWITLYPDQPSWAPGEVMTVASSPAVQDLSATVPPGYELKLGNALVIQPGRGVGHPLIPAGEVFADGQGKAAPFVAVWLQHLRSASDWSSVGAAADLGVGGVGISQLWAEGNPVFPPGFSAVAWSNARFAEAIRRLYTWETPVCGPSPFSGDTGEQEDQLFHPGGEALQIGGMGAETVRLLSALKLHTERPCNHLEADGSPLDLSKHPGLAFWDCRPHGRDLLGKPRTLSVEETHGRWGADTQHFLTRTLGSSARLTGSPAAQWLLSRLTVAYLLQRTDTPGSAYSATFSAREWGYEGLFVVQVDRDLEDRALAAAAVARWRSRVDRILLPQTAGKDHLFAFVDDSRLGPGRWVIAWQEALGAYGIDTACSILGPAAGRGVALRVAKRVLADGWAADGSKWLTRAQFPLDAALPAPDGSFNGFGMPLAVSVVLRHEATNTKAVAIRRYLLSELPGQGKWLAPDLPPR